ncbi:Uncharacterised protein [Candidatus Gugararchaeum adminiculabundum]|nr:Uncharacterised protein [Candidatus Gugararchaeum adminiculabundum]
MENKRVTIVGAIVFVELLFLAFLFLGKKPEFLQVGNMLSPLLSLAAFTAIFRVYSKFEKGSMQRRVWLFLALGMLCWFIGEMESLYYAATSASIRVASVFSIGEIAWLAGYVFFSAALFFQLRYFTEAVSRKGGIVEAGVNSLKESGPAAAIAMVGSLLIAVLVIGFMLVPINNSAMIFEQKLMLFAYLLGDFILIVMSLLLLSLLVGGELEAPFGLLAGALTIAGLTDVTITTALLANSYIPGGALDFFSLLVYVALMASGEIMRQKLVAAENRSER